MVTLYADVVSEVTLTAKTWFDDRDLTNGGHAIRDKDGNWQTIIGTHYTGFMVTFITYFETISVKRQEKVTIGFRAQYSECPQCRSRNHRTYNSESIDDEETGMQIGERAFYVCNDCKTDWIEED